MALGTAGIFVVIGFINLNGAEDLGITFLCFLSAGLFLYSYLGKSRMYCSLSEINNSSRGIVLGDGDQKKNKWTPLQIGALTFFVILLFFSVGFGIGRAIYQITN